MEVHGEVVQAVHGMLLRILVAEAVELLILVEDLEEMVVLEL